MLKIENFQYFYDIDFRDKVNSDRELINEKYFMKTLKWIIGDEKLENTWIRRSSSGKGLHIVSTEYIPHAELYRDKQFIGSMFFNNKGSHWAERYWFNPFNGSYDCFEDQFFFMSYHEGEQNEEMLPFTDETVKLIGTAPYEIDNGIETFGLDIVDYVTGESILTDAYSFHSGIIIKPEEIGKTVPWCFSSLSTEFVERDYSKVMKVVNKVLKEYKDWINPQNILI